MVKNIIKSDGKRFCCSHTPRPWYVLKKSAYLLKMYTCFKILQMLAAHAWYNPHAAFLQVDGNIPTRCRVLNAIYRVQAV